MTPERAIVESVYALACSLPSSTVESVAAAILTSTEGSLRAEFSKRVPHHQHRDMALRSWIVGEVKRMMLMVERSPWLCNRWRCRNPKPEFTFEGMILIHYGDESGFMAKRKK